MADAPYSSSVAFALAQIFFDDETSRSYMLKRNCYEMKPIHALYRERVSANTSYVALLPKDVSNLIMDYIILAPNLVNVAGGHGINYIIHVQVCKTSDVGKY
jgi:hypothetical protein